MNRRATLLVLFVAGCSGQKTIYLSPPDDQNQAMVISIDDLAPVLFDLSTNSPLEVSGVRPGARVEALMYASLNAPPLEGLMWIAGTLRSAPSDTLAAPLPAPVAVYSSTLDERARWLEEAEVSAPSLLEHRVPLVSDCRPIGTPTLLADVGRFEGPSRHSVGIAIGGGLLIGWDGMYTHLTANGLKPLRPSTPVRLRAGADVDSETWAVDDRGDIYDVRLADRTVELTLIRSVTATGAVTKMIGRRANGDTEVVTLSKESGQLLRTDDGGSTELYRFAPRNSGDETEAAVLFELQDPRKALGLGTGPPGFVASVPYDPNLVVVSDGRVQVVPTDASGFTAAMVDESGGLLLADTAGDYWLSHDGEWSTIQGLGGTFILQMLRDPPGFITGGVLGRLQAWAPVGGYCPSLMLGFSVEHALATTGGFYLAGSVPNDEGRLAFAVIAR